MNIPDRIPDELKTRTPERIPIDAIVIDPDFRFRSHGTNPAHVRTLTQSLRAKGRLSPILLWRDEGTDEGKGRLVLLDGAHRLAAHHTRNRKAARGPFLIDALIFE